MAKLPSSGISNYLVARTIGVASTDVGTLCTSGNVNKWSKWKPVKYLTRHKLTEAQLKATRYGLRVPGNSINLITPTIKHVYDDDYDVTAEEAKTEWAYLQPKVDYDKEIGTMFGKPIYGSVDNYPFRKSDFCEYNHSAAPLITGPVIRKAYSASNAGYLYDFTIDINQNDDGSLIPNIFTPYDGVNTVGTTVDNCYFGIAIWNVDTSDGSYELRKIWTSTDKIGTKTRLTIPALDFGLFETGDYYISCFLTASRIEFSSPGDAPVNYVAFLEGKSMPIFISNSLSGELGLYLWSTRFGDYWGQKPQSEYYDISSVISGVTFIIPFDNADSIIGGNFETHGYIQCSTGWYFELKPATKLGELEYNYRCVVITPKTDGILTYCPTSGSARIPLLEYYDVDSMLTTWCVVYEPSDVNTGKWSRYICVYNDGAELARIFLGSTADVSSDDLYPTISEIQIGNHLSASDTNQPAEGIDVRVTLSDGRVIEASKVVGSGFVINDNDSIRFGKSSDSDFSPHPSGEYYIDIIDQPVGYVAE